MASAGRPAHTWRNGDVVRIGLERYNLGFAVGSGAAAVWGEADWGPVPAAGASRHSKVGAETSTQCSPADRCEPRWDVKRFHAWGSTMNISLTDQILAEVRKVAALQLWNLGAIKVNLLKPFQLTSGNFSPLYVNCRELISSPSFADLFCAGARILCEAMDVSFDVIAGGESAGIPFAAFLARAFGRPMIYVRKDAKLHGLGSRIEGKAISGDRVVLVEDLITDAGSKLNFIDAIRASGGQIGDVLVVFDRLQGGREALEKVGIRLHSLADLAIALQVAEGNKLLSAEDIAAVHGYLRAPKLWHQERGLSFKEVAQN